jgi:hypothetical protein
VVLFRIQWQAKIKEQSLPSTFNLDATTAYMLAATMDACTHDVSILLPMLSVPKYNMFTGKPILEKYASQI